MGMKELRMSNGDVVDADNVEAVKTDDGDWRDFSTHRLANAEPPHQPEDAPRDDNNDPILD